MPDTHPAQRIESFLASLPPDRRSAVEQVRAVICENLPVGYEETISKNMLVYQVPFAEYSDTYNGHPLWYVALASEKSYLSLHLMPVYGDATLKTMLNEGFKSAGKKLDMGKACIHFHAADDLELDTIAQIVSAIPMSKWIAIAKSARQSSPAKGRKKTT